MKKIIKIFFSVTLLVVINNLFSAEFDNNNTSIIKIIDAKKLRDGTHYRSFEVEGGSTYNTGKYANSNSSGNRVDKMGNF